MKLPFRSKRAPGWLAIRERGNEIDIAHVAAGGARARVSFCATFRSEGDAGAALARLRREHDLARYRCTALLAPGEYQLNAVDAPNVPADERKGAARWRVKDLIDYPLDAARIEVLDIPVDEGARNHQLYAVSAHNDVLRRTVRRFQDAGIVLSAIDIPELAQRNVAALFEERDRGVAFLAFEESGGLLTVTFRGELYLTRRIDIPLSRLLTADPEARAQLHERIALEVQRSLDHFDRQYSFIVLSRFMLAPLPVDTGLAEYLAGNIYVRLERADMARALDCAGIAELADPARQALSLQVIGAALRDEGLVP